MHTLERILKWENARALLVVLFLCGLTVEAVHALKSPAIPLLPPYRDGAWIRPGWPTNLVAMYGDAESAVFYRKQFTVSGVPRSVNADLTAYRNASVFLDGRTIATAVSPSWKHRIRFVLPDRRLAEGPHELLFKVGNRMGPPLFHFSSDFPGLGDPAGWEYSQDGLAWRPAARCDEPMIVEMRSLFPTVPQGLRRCVWLLVPLFAGFLALAWFRPRPLARLAAPVPLRWILLALWVVLGINNMFKLPIHVGFDPEAHVEYFSYLLQNHRLPTASEGVQMFQPPLYYLLAALLYRLFTVLFPPETSLFLLRIIPLFSALLILEITSRVLREIYPGREDLQSCGLLVGGLLPMNLYMSQYFGNEPLTALLTSLLLYRVIATFRKREPIRWKDAVLLGGVGGLAMLAKATPALLIPVVFLLFLIAPGGGPAGAGTRLRHAGLFLLAAGAVSGWFYARNWILFGKPFLGGWDPSRNISWWQDPGYRTVGDFLTFGEALRQPIYAAFSGFADAVYSTFWSDGYLSGIAFFEGKPPWDYLLLAAGTALSVVPASAMGIGVATGFWRAVHREDWPITFLLAAIGIYLAALVHLYLSLPIYSTAKATYLMGLTPGFGVMAAAGAGIFLRKRSIGPVFAALLATWGVTTYLAYFVH